VADEADALLRIEPRDDGNNGFVFVAQPEALAQRTLVLVFIVERGERIFLREEAIDFGIPVGVIDAVEHASAFRAMLVQDVLEPVAELGVHDFMHVAARNGADEI